MTTFLQSLEDRKPHELETSKRMPRETIKLFFDACNVRVQTPAFAEGLAKYVISLNGSGQPQKYTVDMQRSMLETLGFDADHGCTMLSRIEEDFPKDEELQFRKQQWAGM